MGRPPKYCPECSAFVYRQHWKKTDPEVRKRYSRNWYYKVRDNPEQYKEHIARKQAYSKQRWKEAKENPEKLAELRQKHNEFHRRKMANDPAYHERQQRSRRESIRRKMKGLREEVFRIYGCRCACCGESIGALLTLDHIQNDGKADREELHSGIRIYEKAIAEYNPLRYQVLCFNCNLGRAGNNGVCPHKSPVSTLRHFNKGVIR